MNWFDGLSFVKANRAAITCFLVPAEPPSKSGMSRSTPLESAIRTRLLAFAASRSRAPLAVSRAALLTATYLRRLQSFGIPPASAMSS